jgi:hypothetical protein
MFQFPSFASSQLWIHREDVPTLLETGFPIRKSPGLGLFATTRGLSQLTTSFIAFLCQGIHHVPLVT